MSDSGNFTEGEKLFLQTALVFLVYWLTLWILGGVWWKAPVVGLLVGAMFYLGWASRWISRGAVALLTIGTLVWIEILPPAQQWAAVAKSIVAIAR